MLSWLHIGDPHVTGGSEQNIRDLCEIVAQANAHLAGSVDFVLLPGDIANNGTPEQYRLVREAVRGLRLPLHAIPGNHDVEPGSLDAYPGTFGAPSSPRRELIGDHRCLFLDVVSAGQGGPDFRLGAAQMDWLDRELAEAEAAGQPCAMFMHVYPADLRDGAEGVAALFRRAGVAFVAMGHTHYNELSNDGRTIYAAVRSTGQVEEGPVGFALTVLEDGIASWRFKGLARPWPFCLITAPADQRLITDPTAANQVSSGLLRVRCRAWGAPEVVRATCRVDEGQALPMTRTARQAGMSAWARDARAADGARRLTVRVEAADGQADKDSIVARISQNGAWTPPGRVAAGSGADAVGAWPEKGIPGGQLGPNRNGRQW